jgi:hypothetical protein
MREFLAINATTAGTYRTEKLSGKDYIVAPVVALVEGVIQGVTANQPELALASEFGRFPGAWNGRPVTIDHPWVVVNTDEIESDPSVIPEVIRVSASDSPDVLDAFQVGFIFNTKVSNAKLMMEIWLDPQKMQHHSQAARDLLAHIKAGDKVEVSTGLFTGSEDSPGAYDGSEYAGIWRGVVPDHLALLPGDLIGACSIEDGCGVYANAKRVLPTTQSQSQSTFRVHRLTGNCSCEECSMATTRQQAASDLSSASPGNANDRSSAGSQEAPLGETLDWDFDQELTGAGTGDSEVDSGEVEYDEDGNVITPPKKQIAQVATDRATLLSRFTGLAEALGIRANKPKNHRPPKLSIAQKHAIARGILALALPDGLMSHDAHSSLQSALDAKFSKHYPYLTGFTNKHAIYSREDGSGDYGSRKNYRASYDIDPKTKNGSIADDEKQVNLSTAISLCTTATASKESDPMANSNAPTLNITTDQLKAAALLVNAASATNSGQPKTAANAKKPMADDDDEEDDDGPDAKSNKKGTKPADEDATPVKGAKADFTGGSGKGNSAPPQPQPQTLEQFLAAAPPELRPVLEASLKMHSNRKAQLVGSIKANARNKFTDEQLNSFELPMLENLAEMAVVPNYGGQGGFGVDTARVNAQQQHDEKNEPFAAPPPRLGIADNRSAKKGEAAA